MKFTFPPESKPLDGFTIKRAVHRGGFGEVYYALTDAGKEVALKLLHQHTDVELRGATACLNLNHPNLVTIYDIKTDADGDHWIIMEYVGGKRLCDALEEKGRLPVEEIERWLDGMTAGLTFLHDRGIVHRDLKPSNVFSENGVVKIGDVGLSKFISESRRSAHTQSVGTVYYMAPEVARGRYGREVDVYALGVMLYEMLTGEVPFDGESTGEILMKHLSSPPDLEKVPARLRPVLARALEKDPQKRTATVNRLRDEFKAAVRGRVIDELDEAEELPPSAFLDGLQTATHELGQQAPGRSRRDGHRYSREQREAAARGYAAGARKAGIHDPCGERGSCGRRTPTSHVRGHSRSETNWTPVIVILGVVFFLVFTRVGRALMPSLWEAAILAALAYGVYSAVKWLTRQPTPAPVRVPVNQGTAATVSAFPSAPNMATVPSYVAHRRVPTPTPETPRKIAVRERVSQISGSMTVAALAAMIMTVALLGLGFLKDLPTALFFGSTATIGSWVILASAKFFEGTPLDRTTRRLWQGVAGLATGFAAYGLDQYLLVDFPREFQNDRYYGLITQIGDVRFAASNSEPALAAYLAFFGLLFLLRRWWWQADSYRPKRFKVSSALLTGLLGYVLTVIIYFPHVWGILWAVVMACIVQLAAAWTPPEHRRPAGASPPTAPPAA